MNENLPVIFSLSVLFPVCAQTSPTPAQRLHQRAPHYYKTVTGYSVHNHTFLILTLALVLCPACYCFFCLPDSSPRSLLLTQADVVMEKSQEVVALLPVVAACCAGAPGSHVGCGVVKVVGSYCASCWGGERWKTTRFCMFTGSPS